MMVPTTSSRSLFLLRGSVSVCVVSGREREGRRNEEMEEGGGQTWGSPEGAVAAVVPDDKEAGEGRARDKPGKGQQVPGRRVDGGEAGAHGHDGRGDSAPCLTLIKLEHRRGKRPLDIGEGDIVGDGDANLGVPVLGGDGGPVSVAHLLDSRRGELGA